MFKKLVGMLLGTEETVQNLCLDDIVSFYKTCFRPAYANIGVSGDITVQRFEELVESQFADHTFSSIRPKVALPAPRTLSGQTIILMDKPERSQTQVLLGHSTVPAGHPDMVPLAVGNTAFGGTFTSRLMQEVRVKRGWSYGAYSGFSVGRELSTYHVNFYPKTEDTIPALKLVLDLIQTLTKEGLPEEELAFARAGQSMGLAFGSVAAGDVMERQAADYQVGCGQFGCFDRRDDGVECDTFGESGGDRAMGAGVRVISSI